jgi:hypothetical protein
MQCRSRGERKAKFKYTYGAIRALAPLTRVSASSPKKSVFPFARSVARFPYPTRSNVGLPICSASSQDLEPKPYKLVGSLKTKLAFSQTLIAQTGFFAGG